MPRSEGTRHGAMATGLAQAKMGSIGIYKPTGTVNPQDIERKGSTKPPAVPGNVGIKQTGRTGGQNRKFAGKVGFQKATGTT